MSDEKKIDDPPQTVYVAGHEDCGDVTLEVALKPEELVKRDGVPRLVGVYTFSGYVEVSRRIKTFVTVIPVPQPVKVTGSSPPDGE